LIAVIGTPHSEQVICQRLLHELLPAASERLISLSAGSLPATPEELIRKLAGAAGEPDPAAVSLPSGSDPGTTEARWIRNQLVPAFAAALAKYAVQRRIWLVITDLDLHAIPQGAVREFLIEVYGQIRSMPWLRVVLFGFEDSVPPKALPVYRPIRLVPPTQTHLSHYIAQRFRKELSQKESEETAAWLWQQALEEQAPKAGQDPAATKVELADALRTVVGRLKVSNLGGEG
jgi:hypothetical protein